MKMKSGRVGEWESGRAGDLPPSPLFLAPSPPRALAPSFLPGVAVWLLIIALTASAATSFDGYLKRVERAAQIVKGLVKGRHDNAQVAGAFETVRQMLPATEDIEFGRDVVHVDNSWLHEAVSGLSSEGPERRDQLAEIANRLGALERRLRDALGQGASERGGERELLQRILARPEYQPEERKESAIKRWFDKLLEAIDRFFSSLSFGGRSGRGPSPLTLLLLRVLSFAVVAAAITFGAITLVRRLRRRPKREKEAGPREVLGEQIEGDVTAEDLIKQAAELARAGEFRTAIRRAYLALLYELERRGKLRLHRSKTNHDYLRALSGERHLYPSVAHLTGTFERVWYGHARATAEDYSDFIERYREAVSSRQ